MDEIQIIQDLVRGIPRAREQVNGVFESDAEIVTFQGRQLACTIDEFSGEEDGFPARDPGLLGWNLVIATISDLLAVGADPAWFLQVLAVPDGGPDDFCRDLMRGVVEALEASGAFLLGGDLSRAQAWRYVGNAIGVCAAGPILRKTSAKELCLYVTGPLGAGNLVMVNPEYPLRLASRKNLMTGLRKHVALAMDSSDGLRSTLLALLQVNPGYSIVAQTDSRIVHADVLDFCASHRLPPEAFLFGSAGEYELVLGVEPEQAQEFERQAENQVIPLGTMVKGSPAAPGLSWKNSRFPDPRPDIPLLTDPRNRADRPAYIQEIMRAVQTLFYG